MSFELCTWLSQGDRIEIWPYRRGCGLKQKIFSLSPHPAPSASCSLQHSQLGLRTSPSDPSGSKSEKSSFQTQLDIPRWQLSTNISICMQHFNQRRVTKAELLALGDVQWW